MDENKEDNLGVENQQGVEQPTQQTYSYGQTYAQTYDQSNQSAYGYGQTNYGMPTVPLDKNGQPLKNNYGMKLTFSILEILCCCGCNLITMIMGIIGCVFTNKANSAYKEGNWDEYKAKSKSASICLWVGLGFAVVGIILNILLWTVGGYGEEFMYGYEQGYNAAVDNSGVTNDVNMDDLMNDITDTAPDVMPETDTQAAVPTEPVTVTPGEAFTDPTITVNGVTVTFPMTYSDFRAAGFYIDAENEEYVVNKNEYYYPTVYDANGIDLGYVYIGNETENPLAMKECTVFGFKLTSYGFENREVTFSMPNGLNQNATKDDYFTAYGEPDDKYESDSYDHQSYQWYNHNDMYYDNEENSITVDFWDGTLDEIDIKYIGWE